MKRIIWGIFCSMVLITATQARWASFADAPLKTSYEIAVKVNKDGTMQELKKIQYEILKEQGRDIVAHYALRYNSASEKIKILTAKTIYQGKEYPLAIDLLEDKPLASAHRGFDQKRQILLAFPKAEIGAKIVLEYSITTTEVPIPGFYATVFDFGHKEYVTKARIKLDSKIPLHILVNDPEKVLRITKNDNLHKLDIVLTRPLFKGFINELAGNVINYKYLTWVSVSSLTSWQQLAQKLAQQYAKVFTQTLPKDFARIAAKAAQEKGAIAQINMVTSLLNDKIKYLTDLRTVKGRIIPRALAEISATQLGDCKDFSAATAAILSKLGYKVQLVLVRRGVGDFYPQSLPDLHAFNHMIVKVTAPNGQVYWIDPTNFQSMAGGIFPDIAGKMALIVDQKNPGYEKIANINPQHAQATLQYEVEIVSDNKIVESGKMILKNEMAYSLIGAGLLASTETIKDTIYYHLSGSILEGKNKKKLQLPDLSSRIVKDIVIDYSFVRENGLFKTNLGSALQLTYDILFKFFNVTQDYVTDLLVDMPHTYKRHIVIKDVKVDNIAALNKELKTPWLYVSRKCKLHNHDVQIDETIVVYKNLITNAELKTPQFLALKNGLEKDFREVAVVFSGIFSEKQAS